MIPSRLVLDVSNNDPIDAATLRKSGAVALVCKATEGSSYHDPTLDGHRATAKRARIPFGSYTFIHPSSPQDEASFYLRHANPQPGDIQPAIDCETTDGHGMGQTATRCNACALTLEAHGYRPILYASSSFWQQLIRECPSLRRLRVWEADYPGRFTRWLPGLARLRVRLRHGVTVVMWQWTDRYQVGQRSYDASRLMAPLRSLLIPPRT